MTASGLRALAKFKFDDGGAQCEGECVATLAGFAGFLWFIALATLGCGCCASNKDSDGNGSEKKKYYRGAILFFVLGLILLIVDIVFFTNDSTEGT